MTECWPTTFAAYDRRVKPDWRHSWAQEIQEIAFLQVNTNQGKWRMFPWDSLIGAASSKPASSFPDQQFISLGLHCSGQAPLCVVYKWQTMIFHSSRSGKPGVRVWHGWAPGRTFFRAADSGLCRVKEPAPSHCLLPRHPPPSWKDTNSIAEDSVIRVWHLLPTESAFKQHHIRIRVSTHKVGGSWRGKDKHWGSVREHRNTPPNYRASLFPICLRTFQMLVRPAHLPANSKPRIDGFCFYPGGLCLFLQCLWLLR